MILTSQSNGKRSLLKYCEWMGKPIACAAIFSTFPTDQGMCCSFNMKKANEIFRGETYSNLINLMQAKDKNQSFPIENKYRGSNIEKNKGLTVILDSNSNLFSPGSVSSESRSFLGMIKPPGSFPITALGSFEIRPGKYDGLIILN